MTGEFPVWIAKGLPGCRKVITSISYRKGSISHVLTKSINYKFDSGGNITEATVTEKAGNKEIITKTYSLKY